MNTKTLLTFTFLITLVLLGGLSYGVYRVREESILASTLQNQADDLNDTNNLAESIRAAKQGAQNDLAALDDLTLTQSKLVPFIELIESVGRTLGVSVDISSVTSDKVSSTASSTVATPVHLAIQAEGPWGSSLGFIHALENLPERVSIDKTTLTVKNSPEDTQTQASSTKSVSRRWFGTVNLTVYVYND